MIDTELHNLSEEITIKADPLKLDLEDHEFVSTIDQFIQESVAYYQKKRLYERQDKVLGYYLGNQLPQGARRLAEWQTPYVENVVYESVRRIKPIATSRLPDLTVKGPDPKISKLVTDVLNTDIQRRKNRRVLSQAHVHEQLYFYAVIKARWNAEQGDYEFVNVHPKNIVWDHTCKTNSADDMRIVAENAEFSIKEICMMFPKAKEDLLTYLGYEEDKDRTELNMASKIKVWEVWFHWYKETVDPDTGESKWEKIHGVVWKHNSVVLGKMRNPYYDYQGKVRLFDPKVKERMGMSDEELLQSVMQDTELQVDTIYYNYFKSPRKPYFFMVYESLGDDPIDATNRIEQVLYFQDHINDEGRQIIDMNERSAGKVVFNSEAIDKKTVKTIDWRNTRQAVAVGDSKDLRASIYHVPMPAAPAQLYKSKEENRSIAFEMLGVNATTRGVKQGEQTLGEAQMFREQDFGFIDDLVEDTINEAAEWMAQWAMQFIRIFYTSKHYRQVVGKDGATLEAAIDQDFIDDGMIVEVGASAVDKMMRKRLAMETFKLGASDILSFYEDLGIENAKEKARRSFLMKTAPQLYYQTYLSDGQPLPAQMMPQAQEAPAA